MNWIHVTFTRVLKSELSFHPRLENAAVFFGGGDWIQGKVYSLVLDIQYFGDLILDKRYRELWMQDMHYSLVFTLEFKIYSIL